MPLPKHCIDCESPTVGTNVLCERCKQDERARRNSEITGNDKPHTTGDIEQKKVPSEVK
jgi:hypothetical protein